ncbi:MAG TPA: menaquinone biosynthesis protein [Parapedobacter sp.]|uniref:menaquinone biosynthetic enzyme MqnA/MqnD family protein n=1 Tax=Parapedobacter sp. TaxID=1958893 RepID=UPI002C049D4B|nr:menaquinone biosynthesis protein [Parapedobacter sp.]HWK56092.1 menaquinone biosynthesis protein [Parapedobacter sp.]
MEKVNISAVSYTNTLPFLYGLQHSPLIDEISLSLDVPSACAHKLINGYADLGIVPVAALPDIPHAQIVSNYCLGANGAVNSVFIYSEKPIESIESLRLDSQSRTSNTLARILLRHYWKNETVITVEGEADAYVEIGDRTFGKQHAHPYVYDLSWHWREFTGLPFTFAVWVANKPLTPSFIQAFNDALAYGLSQREVLIGELPARIDFDYRQYLMENIDYLYTDEKKAAVTTFLKLKESLELVSDESPTKKDLPG